ncbi:MAG: 23S rRNA pseudouridine(1911/1915/1917) synthase RluD [Proteobacteria bacterium]|nr:23S rRNA pseudouridine(1911/1915/1917) synthase RluD [Pseudomonadota bacterium]
MSEARQKIVPVELSGQRLDRALARMFPEYSRSRLKSWLLQGFITVDERAMRPRDPVVGGESVLLQSQPEISVKSEPEALDLDIIFEDEDCLVVNKPVGLVVHPGAGNPRGTLMNGLLHHAPGLDQLPRAGIIHRLDKDTSGLLLVAKTLQAQTALTRELAEREIARHYLAVCAGVLTGGGSIKEPIGRHPVDRLRMSVQRDGKPAVTHYRVIRRFAAHTYVSVQLETGRTHQIRVHFAHRRHALVGDQTYGGRLAIPAGASDRLRDTLRKFRHQALHAEKLAFTHPRSGQNIELQVTPPADFTELLSALTEDSELRK